MTDKLNLKIVQSLQAKILQFQKLYRVYLPEKDFSFLEK